MTQRACASVWIGICRVRRTAERAPSYEQDLFGARSDCLIECEKETKAMAEGQGQLTFNVSLPPDGLQGGDLPSPQHIREPPPPKGRTEQEGRQCGAQTQQWKT